MKKIIWLLTAFTICFSLSLSVVPTYAATTNDDDENMTFIGEFNIDDTETQKISFTTSDGHKATLTIQDIPQVSAYDNTTSYLGIGSFEKQITIDEYTFKISGCFKGYRNPYIARFDSVDLSKSYFTSGGFNLISKDKLIKDIGDSKAEARFIANYSIAGIGTHRMSLIAQLDASSGRCFAYTAGEW